MKEDIECSECGRLFGSKKIFKKHSEFEHDGEAEIVRDKDLELPKPSFLGKRFFAGFLVGVLLTGSIAAAGFYFMDEVVQPEPVEVTVLTCENCDHSDFINANDRLMESEYRTVDYQSEEGQQLLDKYGIRYVPGFIFSKNVERQPVFPRINASLIEREDGYILSDVEDNNVAQRMTQNGTVLEGYE